VNLPLPTARYPIQAAPVLLSALFIAALGEELGWSGYVIDPMQHRWNALEASIVLGLVWAAWHIVPLTQADRSPGWIAWWSLATVASRVSYRLAVQQHREKCICCGFVSWHQQSQLVAVSKLWVAL
jgi:membrane protease YdiL (CAAX protease family)